MLLKILLDQNCFDQLWLTENIFIIEYAKVVLPNELMEHLSESTLSKINSSHLFKKWNDELIKHTHSDRDFNELINPEACKRVDREIEW